MVSPVAGIRHRSATHGTGADMDIADCPSPNFGDRRTGQAVELVVLHYTAMSDAGAAIERLCDPECEVSAHYVIGQDGAVTRLVAEEHRAWHAGDGEWAGRGDINSRSIGIELDNDGASPFSDELMAALETLLADILARHDLPPKAVIGHSDMAPSRKQDPGRRFDWQRLAAAGLSVWPEPAMTVSGFLKDAAHFGYGSEAGETQILEAFRQRFRPDATGPFCVADEAMMAGLARQFPANVSTRATRRIPSRLS